MGRMTAWKEFSCVEDAAPPVNAVKTDHYGGGVSLAGSASTRIHCSWGVREQKSQWIQSLTVQSEPLKGLK